MSTVVVMAVENSPPSCLSCWCVVLVLHWCLCKWYKLTRPHRDKHIPVILFGPSALTKFRVSLRNPEKKKKKVCDFHIQRNWTRNAAAASGWRERLRVQQHIAKNIQMYILSFDHRLQFLVDFSAMAICILEVNSFSVPMLYVLGIVMLR